MRKGNLTREQAVAAVGEAVVDAVERKNCDYTGRVQTDGDTDIEFSASVRCLNSDGEDCMLVAYYYQDGDAVEAAEELDCLSWVISAYEII